MIEPRRSRAGRTHSGSSRFLIRCLTAAWLTGTAVQAGAVQLYGIADSYIGTSKVSGDAQSSLGLQSGGMSLSFWGMTGTEELGGGLKANFRIEGFYQIDTGSMGRAATDSEFSRNAYVGLENRFGEVRLGRLANPMFLATALFDPFEGSTKFSPVMDPLWTPQYGRFIAGDTAWSNAIGYYTPEVSGVSGRFLYALGEQAGTNSSNNAVGMLLFDKAPVSATVAIQRTRVGPGLPTGSWAQTVFMTGLSYDFGVAKAFFQYDGTRASGTAFETDTFQLGATVPFLKGKFMLSGVQSNIRVGNQPDTRRRDFGFGYLYPFSRRTDVYGTVLYDKLSDRGSATTAAVGIRHKF